jgi:hypothetical protein
MCGGLQEVARLDLGGLSALQELRLWMCGGLQEVVGLPDLHEIRLWVANAASRRDGRKKSTGMSAEALMAQLKGMGVVCPLRLSL